MKSQPYWFLAAITIVLGVPGAYAEGFPGQGNAADWSDALPYYNLANKYSSSGRWADAEANYQEAVARYQFDPDFYINLGVAQRNLNDYQSAEQSFKRALKLNDKDWMTWSNLANVYLKQNRLTDCRATFEETLKRKPPASEVAKIKTDIGMLDKFISMQSPPQPQTSGKTSAKSAKANPAAASQQGLQSISGPPSTPAHPATTNVKHEPGDCGQSGWDWVR